VQCSRSTKISRQTLAIAFYAEAEDIVAQSCFSQGNFRNLCGKLATKRPKKATGETVNYNCIFSYFTIDGVILVAAAPIF